MKIEKVKSSVFTNNFIPLFVLIFFVSSFFVMQYFNEKNGARLLVAFTTGYDRNHDGILDDEVFVTLVSRCCGVVSFTRKATLYDRKEYQKILEKETMK